MKFRFIFSVNIYEPFLPPRHHIVPHRNASIVRSILFATTLHFRKPIEGPLHLDEAGGYQEKRNNTQTSRRYPLFTT